MARRGSEFHFARYHMEDENDCQAFRNAFSSLLKQIPLKVDHDILMKRWWYFFEGSIGCIGRGGDNAGVESGQEAQYL